MGVLIGWQGRQNAKGRCRQMECREVCAPSVDQINDPVGSVLTVGVTNHHLLRPLVFGSEIDQTIHGDGEGTLGNKKTLWQDAKAAGS